MTRFPRVAPLTLALIGACGASETESIVIHAGSRRPGP